MTSPWSGFSPVGATLKRGHSKRLYSEASCGVTALLFLAQLFNEICRSVITPNAVFLQGNNLALKYSKTKYRKDFLMLAGNGIEIHTAPNEFIPTFKLPTLPATLKANSSPQKRHVLSSKGNILIRLETVDRHFCLDPFFLPH